MGIDASTQSIAFCIFDGQRPVKYGKVKLTGADVYERILDAKVKTRAILAEFDVDYIVIEAAVMVRSVSVAVKLAYVFGAIIGELMDSKTKVVTATPVQWQAFIENKNFTKVQRDKLKADNPGKKISWYRNQIREQRKQYTMDFFNTKFSVNIEDNDVGDAFGLAYYAVKKLVV